MLACGPIWPRDQAASDRNCWSSSSSFSTRTGVAAFASEPMYPKIRMALPCRRRSGSLIRSRSAGTAAEPMLINASKAVSWTPREASNPDMVGRGRGTRFCLAEKSSGSSNAWISAGMVSLDAEPKPPKTPAAARRTSASLSVLSFWMRRVVQAVSWRIPRVQIACVRTRGSGSFTAFSSGGTISLASRPLRSTPAIAAATPVRTRGSSSSASARMSDGSAGEPIAAKAAIAALDTTRSSSLVALMRAGMASSAAGLRLFSSTAALKRTLRSSDCRAFIKAGIGSV